jgi:hypothetical protein
VIRPLTDKGHAFRTSAPVTKQRPKIQDLISFGSLPPLAKILAITTASQLYEYWVIAF